jgi:CubicO group peptidase (beta-lactamase class C family)
MKRHRIVALIFSIVLGAGPGVSLASSLALDTTETTRRIRTIEAGDIISFPNGEAPVSLDINALMTLFRDPGLSVAVIHNYRIDWAKGYGKVEIGSSQPVAATTLFQAGSISKVVTAVGALHLVETGTLSLDDDVNERLVTWRVPENVLGSVAQWEREAISERTAFALAHKRQNGYRTERWPSEGAVADSMLQSNSWYHSHST